MSAQWRRETVDVLTGAEPGQLAGVPGFVNRDVPGLAITPTTTHDVPTGKLYAITHTGSGRAIADELPLARAKAVAWLLRAYNWTLPAAELSPRLEAVVAEAIFPRIVCRGLKPLHRGERVTKPQQPAARARWADRVKLIGVTLDSMARTAGPLPNVYAQHRFHVSAVARLTRIPETSLRTIAAESLTEIRVPGHVVGYEANWFAVALDGRGS